jgi:hypothetical protein
MKYLSAANRVVAFRKRGTRQNEKTVTHRGDIPNTQIAS